MILLECGGGRSPRRARRSDARERAAWARQRLFIGLSLIPSAAPSLYPAANRNVRRPGGVGAAPAANRGARPVRVAARDSTGRTTSPSRRTARAERRRRQFIYPKLHTCGPWRLVGLGGWRLPAQGPRSVAGGHTAQEALADARTTLASQTRRLGPGGWGLLWRVDALDHSSDSCRE